MKRYARGVLYFVGYALFGPAIAGFHVWTDIPMSYFLFVLAAQIWPFWMFTQYETEIGYAVSLATGWNIVVFALLGLLTAVASRNRIALALLFAIMCVAQLWWFRFAMGSLPRELVARLAMAAALALIAVLFVLVARTRDTQGT